MVLPAKRKRQTSTTTWCSCRGSRRIQPGNPLLHRPLPEQRHHPLSPVFRQPGLHEWRRIHMSLDEDNKGMLMGNYLEDELSDPSEVDYYEDGDFTHTNSERYWIRGKADHDKEGLEYTVGSGYRLRPGLPAGVQYRRTPVSPPAKTDSSMSSAGGSPINRMLSGKFPSHPAELGQWCHRPAGRICRGQ